MSKRPLSVTIIGCVYVLTGVGGMISHAAELRAQRFAPDAIPVELVSLVALISGIYLLRGANWARWLALGWILFHVAVSYFDGPCQMAVHCGIGAVLAYFLTRGAGARYFRPEAA